MKLEKRSDGWWITQIPECPDCGPYNTKDDAREDLNGLDRFHKHCNDRKFFTTDKR